MQQLEEKPTRPRVISQGSEVCYRWTGSEIQVGSDDRLAGRVTLVIDQPMKVDGVSEITLTRKRDRTLKVEKKGCKTRRYQLPRGHQFGRIHVVDGDFCHNHAPCQIPKITGCPCGRY